MNDPKAADKSLIDESVSERILIDDPIPDKFKKFTPAQVKALQRITCKDSLRYLCREQLGMKDWDVCHDELMQWMYDNRNRRFKLILLPRGHLKTSVLTVGKTIQDLLIDPDVTVLLASAVWNNARSFLSEIKEYLTARSQLPVIFSRFDTSKWNQDEVAISQRSRANKTSTIDTAGIDKVLTGQHYKRIRADDLVTRENVTTQDQIGKVINYIRDLTKLLEPDGEMEVIGTRWHDGDAYGYILRELADSSLLGGDAFAVYKRGAVERGKPIFPKKFSLQSLANLKVQLGSYDYATNYDNEPVSPETQVFKPPARVWTTLGEGAVHTITVDLAGEGEKGDFTVVMDCAITKSNQLCVVEYARGHFTVTETLDKIFQMAMKHRVRKVGIESVAYQRIFARMLEDQCRERNIFFETVPIYPHREKTARLRSLLPRWESGNLLLKQGMVELEDEMYRFPVSVHDDVLDSLEMQLHVIQPQYLGQSRSYIPSKWSMD